MCLDTITKRKLAKSEREGTGWKVFELNGKGTFCYPFFTVNKKSVAHRGKWLQAERKYKSRNVLPVPVSYYTGFHIFTVDPRNLPGFYLVSNRKVVQVRYRKARLKGTQSGMFGIDKAPIVVADEMFIPRNKPVKNG